MKKNFPAKSPIFHVLFAVFLSIAVLSLSAAYINVKSKAEPFVPGSDIENDPPIATNVRANSAWVTSGETQTASMDILAPNGYNAIKNGYVNVYVGLQSDVSDYVCKENASTCRQTRVSLQQGMGSNQDFSCSYSGFDNDNDTTGTLSCGVLPCAESKHVKGFFEMGMSPYSASGRSFGNITVGYEVSTSQGKQTCQDAYKHPGKGMSDVSRSSCYSAGYEEQRKNTQARDYGNF